MTTALPAADSLADSGLAAAQRWLAARPWLTAGLMLLLGAWFFLVFPTEPLYFENQNTKFLHGMALAGIGHLDRDWTANTVDVMPIFTGIVYALHVATPPAVCYVVQILLFSIFLYAVVEIAGAALGDMAVRHPWFPVCIGVITVASQFSNGGARVWGGVAKQYLLSPALEPQSFGVLFLLAVVWFLKKRTESALWLTAAPAIIHPGYVVPAGTLILAFLLVAWRDPDRSRRPGLPAAFGSLAAASTSLVYLGLMILPSSAESWSQANEILAKVRIPRHAVPAAWFDVDAAAKIVGCGLALWLVRKRSPDLFGIIGLCYGVALSLTLLAAAIDSNELGMISPWRISVYLVPLGLAVLLAWPVSVVLSRAGAGMPKGLGMILAVLAIAATARGAVEKVDLYRTEPTADHVTYMRNSGDARTLYLTDPFDMNIRLRSGLPQLVSWKTHPYKDVEVLEWHRRFEHAARVFEGEGAAIDCAALDEAIGTYGVTHLLLDDARKDVSCASATAVFEGGKARIYELSP